MPQLPVISPGQTKMTTASPNRRLDPSAESQPGRDVANMGKAVAQMGFRMQEVQNLQQRTKASSNATAKRNKIMADQAADPRFDDDTKAYYEGELKKVTSGEAPGISHMGTRALFLANQEGATAAASLKIENNMRTKMLTDLDVRTQEVIYNEKVAAATATTQAEKDTAELNVQDLLAMLNATGAITPKEYMKQKLNLKDDFKEFEFQTDLRIDPDATPLENKARVALTRQKLRDGTYGFTFEEQIKAEEAVDMVSDRVDEEEKDAKEKIMDANGSELIDKVTKSAEQFTVVDIMKFNAEKPSDQQIVNDMIEFKMKKSTVNYQTAKQIYVELADTVVDSDELIKKTRAHITSGIKDSNVQALDGANLNQLLDKLGIEAEKYKKKKGSLNRMISSSLKRIKSTGRQLGDNLISQNKNNASSVYSGYKEVIDNIISGKLATEEAIEEFTNKIVTKMRRESNPHIANMGEQHTLMMDSYGNKAMVNPDGTFEEVVEEDNGTDK